MEKFTIYAGEKNRLFEKGVALTGLNFQNSNCRIVEFHSLARKALHLFKINTMPKKFNKCSTLFIPIFYQNNQKAPDREYFAMIV